MNNYAGVLFITKENTLLLQQRDDKPNIVNPGMITTFGGLVEDNETPIEGLLREINEETNLKPKGKDLIFFKNLSKVEDDGTETLLHLYLLKDISKSLLDIYEGKGWFEIKKEDELSNINLSSIARIIVNEYFYTI